MQAEVGSRPAGGQDQPSVADVPQTDITWRVWPKKNQKKKRRVGEKLLVFTDGGAYELAKIPSSLWSELQQKTAEVAFISRHSNKRSDSALSPH